AEPSTETSIMAATTIAAALNIIIHERRLTSIRRFIINIINLLAALIFFLFLDTAIGTLVRIFCPVINCTKNLKALRSYHPNQPYDLLRVLEFTPSSLTGLLGTPYIHPKSLTTF